MTIGAIVLARMDSRRLPGKALRLIKGKPLVQYAFDACKASSEIEITVLATSDRAIDDELAAYASSQGLGCFRGSADDVAGRFLGAMEHFGFDAALRFTGDSPLHRPTLLDEAIAIYRRGGHELVSNTPGRTYPFGMSVEVVQREAMRAACATMTDDSHREHVTKFFYDTPSFARIFSMRAAEPDMHGIQLAVDEAEDLERTTWILDRLQLSLLDAPLRTITALARKYDATRG